MEIHRLENRAALAAAAAAEGARRIRETLRMRPFAHVILATGASQLEMLAELRRSPGVEWGRVDLFHLDEYLDLAPDHPAGFRRYLTERFIDLLPTPPRSFHPVGRENLDRLNREMADYPIDVAFLGIGENGHIAFNDPPADFDTEIPYRIVALDDACRRQQLGEGWFATLDAVPKYAVTMSVRQIMKSRTVINTVPDARKASAVKAALHGPVTQTCPASILQRHPDCHTYLDPDSAALLEQ